MSPTKITRKTAKKAYNDRSPKSRKRDGCTIHSKLQQHPTTEWMEAPGRSDVIGIDAPGYRVKGYIRKAKGGSKRTVKVKGYYRAGKKVGPKCGNKLR